MVLDDEPDDGPQHYIYITGFHHPHFLSHLADININVDCIIRINSENYDRYEPKVPEVGEGEAATEEIVVEKDEKTLGERKCRVLEYCEKLNKN